MEKIYQDGSYLDKNQTWHTEDSDWKLSQVIKMIRKHDELILNSITEVGCGAGLVLDGLSKEYRNCKFKGFDIAPNLPFLWDSLKGNSVEYSLEDFLHTNSLDKSDLLLSLDVFEHVPDYMGFLEKLRNRSNYFIFNIPLDMHVLGILLEQQGVAREKYGHLHYFSESTALSTLRDCKYHLIDYFYAPGFSGQPIKSYQQTILLPLRKILFNLSPKINSKLLGGASLLVLASSDPVV